MIDALTVWNSQVGCFKLLLLQGFYLNVVLLLAVTATTVLGRPDGAPIGACPNIYPVGHTPPPNNTANMSALPYTVNTDSLANGNYTPGQPHSSKH